MSNHYVRPRRYYRNKRTGLTSPLLHAVVDNQATVVPHFTCGVRQGTWRGSPFAEVETVPAMEMVPDWLREAVVEGESLSVEEALPLLFDAVCDSIERAWQPGKFHIVFHSSGWDSRIISKAIKQLTDRNGWSWLGRGLLFLSNRWEAEETQSIIANEGWPDSHFIAYTDGSIDEHFTPCLDFARFWEMSNAPLPIPGNLWWYLPEWLQARYKPPWDDDELQGFAGIFANETWRWFNEGGPAAWLAQYERQYYYAAMAMYPQKIPHMEYPMTDLEVLKIVARVTGTSGDKLRQLVAEYACPEANDVPHLTHDDRGHPISDRLRRHCRDAYASSWYACHVQREWDAPKTSEYNVGWCRWGLASLCEDLVRRGVNVRVGEQHG